MVDAVSGTLRGIFIGSVFADDSSQIIDGNSFTVYGNIQATTLRTAETKIALGENAGLTSQGVNTVAIGLEAGQTTQGSESVAIGYTAGKTAQGAFSVAVGLNAGQTSQGNTAVALGYNAGQTSQGQSAVAIGFNAGSANQAANTIILNATGVAVNGVAAQTNSFYVDPIRTTANGTPLMYNSTTKEITYSTVLEFVGSKISTNDSSGLTVDVQTTFNTDVTVENDLDVTQRLRVQGSRVINITELQAIVAASTDFTAFKTAIAGLV
jgi:GH24 family phage-related lysozyme (muramidase)